MRKLEHFREHKFEAILDEQGTAMEKLEEECSVATTEAELLRGCITRCTEITAAVAHTVGGFVSPLAIADLQSDLDAFGAWINGSVSVAESKHMSGFRGSIQAIVSYLRGNVHGYGRSHSSSQTEDEELCGQMTTTMRKLHALRSDIDGVAANACVREQGS